MKQILVNRQSESQRRNVEEGVGQARAKNDLG